MGRELSCLASLVLVLGLAAGVASADIETGLVGYWPLNEGTGDTTADISGNGHDGTLYNGATWILPGFIGNAAMNFDGDPGSRVSVGTWDPGDLLTLAVWARWTGEQNKAPRTGIIGKRDDWTNDGIRWFSEVMTTGEVRMRTFNQTVGSPAGMLTAFIDEWAHIAITFDGSTCRIYLNAEEVASGSFSLGPGLTAAVGLGCKAGAANSNTEIFSGDLDDARIYNRALIATDVEQLFGWTGIAGKAYGPDPVDGKRDVPRDVVLTWAPGQFASPLNGHKVYFSENFADVSNGIGGITQSADSYDPPQRLDFEKTYYWRVDEVNMPPDSTVFEGDVWSFTVESFSSPVEGVLATASSSTAGKGPANTVNGSGLDAGGLLHDRVGEAMWLSDIAGPQPSWIEFEFGKVQKLHEMWVWNSNDGLEPVIGFGFQDVTIEYSADGIDFVTLGTTHEFTRAPGADNYAHDTTIDFGGAGAKYVRLTANSNWGGILPQFGLSEVRFLSIPVQARGPDPASGAAEVTLDLELDWIAGREAASHEVYLSDDLQAVAEGTAPFTNVAQSSHGPLALDLGKTYFWRVDEVNDVESPARWRGDVWDFTTIESLVVEDFESYDAADNQIWFTWYDGLGFGVPGTPDFFGGNGTGAAVGDENTASSTEETIVRGGNQSMPLSYNNNKPGALNYSETTLTLDSQKDWTVRGVGELSVWFRGYPASVGSFVEAPAGTFTVTAEGADIWNQADEFHYVYKQLSGVGSIIARVDSVENTDPWAKSGVMIRETLDAGSKFAAVYITPANDDGTPTQGCRFQARTDTDGSATSDSSPTLVATPEQMAITAPYWVKIERDITGNFRGSYSSNGTAWTPMVWRPLISMESSVYVGLALTSHNAAVTGEAVFSGTQTTGAVTGQWQSQDIGILSNSAEPLYVEIANGNGTSGLVSHDDPAATQIDTWTEWRIDLQQFADQGVNLTNVDSITIGTGDKNNPQPRGSGKMFFDDIGLFPEPAIQGPKTANVIFEAEAADILGSNWRLYNDSASSGSQHIGSDDGDGDDFDTAPGVDWAAVYNFTVAADGIYKILLRGQEAGADSFWVRITTATSQTLEHPDQPGTGWVKFNGMDAPNGWAWDEVHSDDDPDDAVANWTLAAGEHTLEIAKREDGVLLDAILITDDLALDQATLP
ncbi:MAG: hypothetical protein ISS70_04730 [Phycisphaerae bacterium]|nr:hypothetical protein [Phycisphaerae bacterium]